ncbi:MAG: 7-carboxy-7-deazaguanine synthase QueE [Elusimicrobiota bacterium]
MKRYSSKKDLVGSEIFEIFCSYQGEGFFVGEKQIFVRFSGCNLNCSFCDEPAAVSSGKKLSVDEVCSKIKKLSRVHSTKAVSLTGGEPLLEAKFIEKLCQRLSKSAFRFRLETNGTMPEALKRVLPFMEHVSADIKLPSMSGDILWARHRAFLRLARDRVCVKIVVSRNTEIREFKKAVMIIKKEAPESVLFIQPESREFFSGGKIENYDKFVIAASGLGNVRLLPQLHKIWNVK